MKNCNECVVLLKILFKATLDPNFSVNRQGCQQLRTHNLVNISEKALRDLKHYGPWISQCNLSKYSLVYQLMVFCDIQLLLIT